MRRHCATAGQGDKSGRLGSFRTFFWEPNRTTGVSLRRTGVTPCPPVPPRLPFRWLWSTEPRLFWAGFSCSRPNHLPPNRLPAKEVPHERPLLCPHCKREMEFIAAVKPTLG